MRKSDVIGYLKLFAGIMLIFPLVHVFFALDFGLFNGFIIAGIIYIVMMILGILMLNYLNYGIITLIVTDKDVDEYEAYLRNPYKKR